MKKSKFYSFVALPSYMEQMTNRMFKQKYGNRSEYLRDCEIVINKLKINLHEQIHEDAQASAKTKKTE